MALVSLRSRFTPCLSSSLPLFRFLSPAEAARLRKADALVRGGGMMLHDLADFADLAGGHCGMWGGREGA